MGDPDVGRSIMTGPMWKAIRIQAGLDQACLFYLRMETGFLGGSAEDMGDRLMSEVTVSGTWADCGVVAEATRTCRIKGTVCPGGGRGCDGGVARRYG